MKWRVRNVMQGPDGYLYIGVDGDFEHLSGIRNGQSWSEVFSLTVINHPTFYDSHFNIDFVIKNHKISLFTNGD